MRVPRVRFSVRRMMAAVGLAAGALWCLEEYKHYLAWAGEAQSEQSLLELASRRDDEVAEFRRKAVAGEPYAPRPHGPIPIGESAPQSWDEEAKYSADQARIVRTLAEEYRRRKESLGRHCWWPPA